MQGVVNPSFREICHFFYFSPQFKPWVVNSVVDFLWGNMSRGQMPTEATKGPFTWKLKRVPREVGTPYLVGLKVPSVLHAFTYFGRSFI